MRRDGDRQCRVTIVRQDGGFRFSICLRTAIRGLDAAQADGPPDGAINATEARGLGRSSGFSFPMYCRIRASSRPAVQAKYPGGRKCDPPKLCLRSLYARPVIYAHGLDASLSPAKPRAPLAHTPRPCDTKTRSLMVANNSSADTVVAAYAAHLLMVHTVMLCGFITIMSRVGAVGLRQVRVVGRLLVLPGVMMLGRLNVMFCRFAMVFRGIFMVLSAFMHNVDSLISSLNGPVLGRNRSAPARAREY